MADSGNIVLTSRHLDELVELVADELNRWQDSNKGDREGALELLLAVSDCHDGAKALSEFGEAGNYLRTRLSELR